METKATYLLRRSAPAKISCGRVLSQRASKGMNERASFSGGIGLKRDSSSCLL